MIVILISVVLSLSQCVESQDLLLGDPDKNRLTQDYITSRGFIDELHTVQTDDGYFIALHRIIHPYISSTKQTILFNTGPGRYSFVYLRNAPGGSVNESLDFVGPNIGFECAKRGYDVWLLDQRATLAYTYNSTRLDPDHDLEFWDFSNDETAFFDDAKAIDYVRFITKKRKIAMIGLGLGNRQYLFLASKVPRFNEIVQPVITLAPAFSAHGTEVAKIGEGLVRFLVPLVTRIRGSALNAFLLRLLTTVVCNTGVAQNLICNPLIMLATEVFFSFRAGSENYDRNSVYLTVFSVMSNWQLAQQAASFLSYKITMLDVDPETNMQRYGSVVPPEYFPESVTNPEMHFFYSASDVFYGGPNYQNLKQRLGARLRSEHSVPIEFSTLSFLDGKPQDVIQYVNIPVLQILQSYN